MASNGQEILTRSLERLFDWQILITFSNLEILDVEEIIAAIDAF